MKTTTNRRAFLAFALAMTSLTACAKLIKPQAAKGLMGMGMIVDYRLAKGTDEKEGVNAVTDAGNSVFGSAVLTPSGGGVRTIGGGTKMSFPRWVRVTWRQGPGVDMDFKNGEFVGGTVIGDYNVEVLSRIPEEIFRYVAAAPGRTIVLKFRIKDDGVLFAWGVYERFADGTVAYKMEGGDKVEGGIFKERVR